MLLALTPWKSHMGANAILEHCHLLSPGGQDAPQSVVFVTTGPGTSPTWAWGEDLIGRQAGGQVQSLT